MYDSRVLERQEVPATGLPGWLQRRLARLRPKTKRQWATYALIALVAVFALFECRATATYSAQVVVTAATGESNIGINPTTESLDFGDLTQGLGLSKYLQVDNGGIIPVRVVIIVRGDIGPFMDVHSQSFTLTPREHRRVEFALSVPPTAAPRKYSGRVIILRFPWSPWP